MAKLNIAIADSDDFYVENLSNYIRVKQANKFQVNCFTNHSSLENYLSKGTKIDVLLISDELFDKDIIYRNVTVVITLSEGRTGKNEKLPLINKYQTGEKIVNQIINIFAENSSHGFMWNNTGDKKTKLIAVYSPVGGAGKTCTALGAAMLCAEQGKNVMYLNLETIQSTETFFDCNGELNLTRIFYYVKEGSKNIKLNLESARIIDPATGVHYFAPPESLREIHELNGEDIRKLLNELRNLQEYDYIFVDMSSEFTENNYTILDNCDHILFLTTPEAVASGKLNSLSKEFKIMGNAIASIEDRITLVLNKYSGNTGLVDGFNINESEIQITHSIPKVRGLIQHKGERNILNIGGEFGNSIAKIIAGL